MFSQRYARPVAERVLSGLEITMTSMSWYAYVDESEPDPRADLGAYLLAAAVVPSEQVQPMRAAVSSLLLRGQHKLRWRNENAQRRKLLTAAVAELDALYVVVVRVGQGASSERRRRLCLRRLLWELDDAGVVQINVEAREAKQNQRDRHLLDALRAERVLSATIKMDHPAGPREPLLWVPDLVAGAVGAARRGEPAYRDQLASLLTVVEV